MPFILALTASLTSLAEAVGGILVLLAAVYRIILLWRYIKQAR